MVDTNVHKLDYSLTGTLCDLFSCGQIQITCMRRLCYYDSTSVEFRGGGRKGGIS
jgi:hypothetical protein